MKLKYVATSLMLIILTACGGGSGGGSDVKIGQFIDDPVAGLTYSCSGVGSTQSITGTTDALGQFNYQAGQTCTFKVGNVTLGVLSGIPSDGKVTPQDVAGVSRAATNAPSALLIAQFLQSLNDGSTAGKIVIPAATRDSLSNMTALTLVSNSGAISQAELENIVVNIAGKTLISASTAQSALDAQISSGVIDKTTGSVSANAPVVLNSITVTAASSSKAAGFSEPLTATGYYSDGSSKDITSTVTWSSSDPSVVSINSSGVSKGLKKGLATLTASLSLEGTSVSIKGTTVQTTTDPILQTIAITNSANPPAGLTDQLKATGSLSDGSTTDLTKLVTWTSSDETKVTVDANGLATGKAKGTATVTASYSPISVYSVRPLAAIVGTSTETVVDPTPLNIVISYVQSGLTSIQNNASAALLAIANMSDQTVQTVSSLVDWAISSVSGGGAASVAVNKTTNTATLTGSSPGIVSTVASYLGLNSNPLDLSISLTVTGVAATGAPISNATLQIYDKTGSSVLDTPASIAPDGTYVATIPVSAVGPFVFEVSNGSDKTYSVLPNKNSSVVNVTPITHLIAAKLSPTGNPYRLVSEIAASTATVSEATTTTATDTIMTSLEPLVTALGLSKSSNPMSTVFTANGEGIDRLLDSLDVKVEPKGTSSKIEITMKQSVDEDEDLPRITFAHNENPSALPAVDATKLAVSGLTPKLQVLLDQLKACYAEPLSTRVTSGGSLATHIQSQKCKDAFISGNPSLYKTNGFVISKTQHFGGIFTAESTAGVSFYDPKFYYQIATSVPNGPTKGDIVFGYRWRDEYGNFQIERNVARFDSDGKLKLIGNQYRYDGGVGPYSQRRNFLNQSESTFNSVGYTFGMSCYQLNQGRANGKIVKVNVTSPNGKVITLVPNLTNGICNYSYMVVAYPKDKSGAASVDGMGDPSYPSGTGFVRIKSEYETGQTTVANHPRTRDTSLAFIGGPSGVDMTTEEIEQIKQFAKWKFEYFTQKSAGSTAVATQYYKTTSRALTIDGFKEVVKLPELTTELKNKLIADSTCLTGSTYCFYKQSTGPFVATWTRSTDPGVAAATYMARVYGIQDITQASVSRIGFEDSLKFLSSRTSASIRCGQGETSILGYCSGTSPSSANFSTNATIDAVDLVSRAPDGTDVSHFNTLRKLP